MKYNTISTSSLSSEGRKSTLTLYTDPDFLNDKVSSSESEISCVRSELEIVQRALTLQTRRCRQLVAEYTRRLQEKEQQYQSEKLLRDDQLAKVLRALLIFEARLKQEQKYISLALAERDRIIRKQREAIHRLSAQQYCTHCNQYYGGPPHKTAESFGSSSEYVATDYHDSNMDSLESSSETYATISTSEREFPDGDKEDAQKENDNKLFQKSKNKDTGKRTKRVGHRKSIGDYYEVLQLRNDHNGSPSSSENTSNDYEKVEMEVADGGNGVSSTISLVSERIEDIFNKSPVQAANLTEDNLDKHDQLIEEELPESEEDAKLTQSKNNETIPQVFPGDDLEPTDNWYASASDAEDEERREWTTRNPNFLECMNQILLQNINDNINSPPKTPTMERKSTKRVKFSDEEESLKPDVPEVPEVNLLNAQNLHNKMADYYETPIQKTPNFYETPQSIYSNDYEQIITSSNKSSEQPVLKMSEETHYYVDMDTKSEKSEDQQQQIVRKSKILRTPPALPPKPANLLSKYKIPKSPSKVSTPSIDSEPDYCSISELNLPAAPQVTPKKLNVVAEINAAATSTQGSDVVLHSPKSSSDPPPTTHYDLDKSDLIVATKPVEKVNIQVAKQTAISSSPKSTKIELAEIPKLPQVSEIIIPEENHHHQPTKEERITTGQDNYIKITTQMFKPKTNNPNPGNKHRPILIGSSVSSLITTFNNQQLMMAELQSNNNKSPPRGKLNKKLFSSFENLQNIERHEEKKSPEPTLPPFDLSQNFEEFKLDECDIDEYDQQEEQAEIIIDAEELPSKDPENGVDDAEVKIPELSKRSIELFNDVARCNEANIKQQLPQQLDPSYEQFLECTGLSSKSILTSAPARVLSNHKGILKPKDVKYRSKARSHQQHVKYWSEPYI